MICSKNGIKEEVLKMIDNFLLEVDLDNWETKGWIRVEDKNQKNGEYIESAIIWKELVEREGIIYVKRQLKDYIIRIGIDEQKQQLKKLLGI